MNKDDEGLSEQRTDLAEDRTVLANERTFAGWMRTSLACIAIGVGFQALFGKVEPGWLPRLVASAFLALAAIVVVMAERRASTVIDRLDAHVVKTTRRMNLRLFTIMIVAGALILALSIWMMPVA